MHVTAKGNMEIVGRAGRRGRGKKHRGDRHQPRRADNYDYPCHRSALPKPYSLAPKEARTVLEAIPDPTPGRLPHVLTPVKYGQASSIKQYHRQMPIGRVFVLRHIPCPRKGCGIGAGTACKWQPSSSQGIKRICHLTPVRADARKREWFVCDGVAVHVVSRAPLNISLDAEHLVGPETSSKVVGAHYEEEDHENVPFGFCGWSCSPLRFRPSPMTLCRARGRSSGTLARAAGAHRAGAARRHRSWEDAWRRHRGRAQGRLAYYESFGYLDKAAGVPMSKDAIFAIASMTKPMVGVGIMQLVEGRAASR